MLIGWNCLYTSTHNYYVKQKLLGAKLREDMPVLFSWPRTPVFSRADERIGWRALGKTGKLE